MFLDARFLGGENRVELLLGQGDPQLFLLRQGGRRSELLRPVDMPAAGCHGLGAEVRLREPDMRHRHLFVEPKRSIEGPGRIDPHVSREIRNPLVVVRLGFHRGRGDLLMKRSRSSGQGYRCLRDLS